MNPCLGFLVGIPMQAMSALWCPPWQCNPSRYPWERAPKTAVAWAGQMVAQCLCCWLVFVLSGPLKLIGPGRRRGCERKHSSFGSNLCCSRTMTVGPFTMGVKDNLNDAVCLQCIYLNPVRCKMKQTNGVVKRSLVKRDRVASAGAFLLVLGQDQVPGICT